MTELDIYIRESREDLIPLLDRRDALQPAYEAARDAAAPDFAALEAQLLPILGELQRAFMERPL